MPTLHSILSVSQEGIQLEAVASRPPLVVNNEIRQEASLSDGDHVEIGGIEFIVHRSPHLEADTTSTVPSPSSNVMVCEADAACDADVTVSDASDEMPNLSELSALELVELIEQDEELIADFEEAQESGVEALLDAVLRRAEAILDDREQNDVTSDADEVEFVLNQLHEMAFELEQRSERLSLREADCAVAAETLLDAQKNLAVQLETLLEQVDAHEGSAHPRAVA